jgi:hypothetical protein
MPRRRWASYSSWRQSILPEISGNVYYLRLDSQASTIKIGVEHPANAELVI